MALLPFEAAFRFYFLISPWLSSSWITCQLYGEANFYWPAGCQLERNFTLISLLFCRRRQRGEIFLSEVFLKYSYAAKEELPCDTSKPLLKVLGNKCKLWSRGVIFPLYLHLHHKTCQILVCPMSASASFNLSLFIVHLLVSSVCCRKQQMCNKVGRTSKGHSN